MSDLQNLLRHAAKKWIQGRRKARGLRPLTGDTLKRQVEIWRRRFIADWNLFAIQRGRLEICLDF